MISRDELICHDEDFWIVSCGSSMVTSTGSTAMLPSDRVAQRLLLKISFAELPDQTTSE